MTPLPSLGTVGPMMAECRGPHFSKHREQHMPVPGHLCWQWPQSPKGMCVPRPPCFAPLGPESGAPPACRGTGFSEDSGSLWRSGGCFAPFQMPRSWVWQKQKLSQGASRDADSGPQSPWHSPGMERGTVAEPAVDSRLLCGMEPTPRPQTARQMHAQALKTQAGSGVQELARRGVLVTPGPKGGDRLDGPEAPGAR